MENSNPTTLTYLDDAYQTTDNATVVGVETREDELITIYLDATIFYPQGGGQPFDLGSISNASGTFDVQQVRFSPDGLVHHIGIFTSGSLKTGDSVELLVDGARRMLNNKLHTAGHLVDVAMIQAGYDFEPSKGYHFPDSPYVEYKGSIPPEEREEAKLKLEAELETLVHSGDSVKWRTVNGKEALKEDCKYIPDYLPEGKPIRVVTISGLGCPCGGTHLRTNAEIGKISIKKIKVKGGNTRVSYRLD